MPGRRSRTLKASLSAKTQSAGVTSNNLTETQSKLEEARASLEEKSKQLDKIKGKLSAKTTADTDKANLLAARDESIKQLQERLTKEEANVQAAGSCSQDLASRTRPMRSGGDTAVKLTSTVPSFARRLIAANASFKVDMRASRREVDVLRGQLDDSSLVHRDEYDTLDLAYGSLSTELDKLRVKEFDWAIVKLDLNHWD